MAPPRVAVVVPWRSGDPDRERAWGYCRGWWERLGWPVHVVEHAPPDPFNRAWCINEGANRARDWDILIAIDADVFCEDPEQVRLGVESARETGRLTVPHHIGSDLTARGTTFLLQGDERWRESLAESRDPCTSRVTIIRRDLWELTGGFDERFRGWGHEDVAFWVAAVSARGVDQLPGTTWHLWHKPSAQLARRTREWREGDRLANRYIGALLNGWVAVERILAERPGHRTGPERRVDVICLTAGRRSYLEKTIASFESNVGGAFGRRTIMDDSGDRAFGIWLRRRFGRAWTIHTTPGRLGFTEAIRSAWAYERAQTNTAPYIFHLEEDFVFDRPVSVEVMLDVLESDPALAQVALLRGPFFPPEIREGGIVQEDPAAYEHRNGSTPPHLVHRKYFTTNPCVYRRDLLDLGWPAQKDSETVFTRELVRSGKAFALMGDGEPWITHIGRERTGRGY